MNPASIDAMSWEMAEVYGAITDQIVINLAHYFPYLSAGKHPPKSMFDYQAAMLAQMGKVNAQTMQIIRNNLSDADRALSASLETAIADAIKDSEPSLYRGAKAGILKPPTKPVLSANQTRAFGLYYKQAADKLNLVNTVMLESTQSAYMQTVTNVISEYEILERLNRTQIVLDVAAGETITGVSSWNTAVRHATQRMKDGGITGFIDHAGRHWDAETYVAMDIRTTMFNTGRAAVWETNEGFGNDLYIVSYHNGARPLCYDWQNKVISANNVSRDVADLDGNVVHVYAQNETTYGEPAGLFGINCKHYPTPFVPGVSAVRGQVQDKAENDKQYAESQKQRALERNLREQKRDLEMLKAQNADEDIIRAQREKVRAASKDIDDFCDETGRVRRRNRESVYTKRDFPSGNYDPAKFAREQQTRFDDYWKNGGTQTGRTFGTMTPNVPLVPNTPPVAPVYDFGGKNATITQEGQDIIKNTLSKLQEQFPIPEGYSLEVGDFRSLRGIGYADDLEDLLDDLETKTNDYYYGVKAQFTPFGSDGKRLRIEYIDTTMPTYTQKEKDFEEIHQTLMRNPGGKPFNAGYGYECDTIHEYGHLLSHVYGFYQSEDPEFVSWFMTLDKETIKHELSIYAATNWNEFFAEAFLQSFSPYQCDLSKQAMEYLKRKMGK